MPFRQLNPNKKWRGVYPGKYAGNIWMTRNMNLERSKGRISLGDKMIDLNDDQDSNLSALGVIHKFLRTNADATDRWWGLARGGSMFKTTASAITGTWAVDTETGTFTDAQDMEIHEANAGEERLVVTRATEIAIMNISGADNNWDPDWGSAVLSRSLTTGKRHPIARVQRLTAIGDVINNTTIPIPVIHTIDLNDVVASSRLQFPTGYEVRNIYPSANPANGTADSWIGLEHKFGGSAKIVFWNGSSLGYIDKGDLIGEIPMCGFFVNEVPYFITEHGYIYKYTGGGFAVVQQFPIVEEQLRFVDDSSPTQTIGIDTYGTYVDENLVYIFVNAPRASRRCRSGIWIFDTITNNLYHAMGVGSQKSSGTELDFGQSPLRAMGALKLSTRAQEVEMVAGGSFIVDYEATDGGSIYREAIFAIQFNKERTSDTGVNRGHFISPLIPISEIEAYWEAAWIKFRRFLTNSSSTSLNTIVVKVRNVDQMFGTDSAYTDGQVLQIEGTMVTTTTFTAVVPTGVAVGDEVEFMSGNGAGCSMHISILSATPDGSASITVTIEEAIPDLAASGERGILVRFDNWIRVGNITSATIGNLRIPFIDKVASSPSSFHGEFIQLKLECRGFEVEIDDVLPVYKVKTKIEQT